VLMGWYTFKYSRFNCRAALILPCLRFMEALMFLCNYSELMLSVDIFILSKYILFLIRILPLLLETIVTLENISNIRFNHTSAVQGRKREGVFILKTQPC
jgi:hypothetical protein